ncbi:MAG: hypothetical protein H7Z41_08300 [Cytophagales bacterium]|nr:hypothetical protein [Armatimonadota bacterium]
MIPEPIREYSRAEQVTREDLILFLNACFVCTGQREFYSDADAQRVSIEFLHAYILGNYRLLYARTLAAGVNDFNQAEIVLNLLATGRDTPFEHRAEENSLITATLQMLPPQRAWRLLEQIRQRRINNRRSRSLVRRFVAGREEIAFDAVKYRSKVRAAAAHAHLPLGKTTSARTAELGRFLFRPNRSEGTPIFSTALFESVRQAHYRAEAVYELPYTVAEGFAAKHGIPRDVFLKRIASQMTDGEKLRLQATAERAQSAVPALDPMRLSLTRLALYVLSLPREKREAFSDALRQSARATLSRTGGQTVLPALGRVAAVLDNSYSSSGSTEKRQRPLGVALAVHLLLQEAAGQGHYRAFWTLPPRPAVMGGGEPGKPLSIEARGQTDLATPLLDALEWGAETILIVSDGFENDPPQGAGEVLRVFRTCLDPRRRTTIIHLNPVFNPEELVPRALSPHVPTIGLRGAEDLATAVGFARFADGAMPLEGLESHLAAQRDRFLERVKGTGWNPSH